MQYIIFPKKCMFMDKTIFPRKQYIFLQNLINVFNVTRVELKFLFNKEFCNIKHWLLIFKKKSLQFFSKKDEFLCEKALMLTFLYNFLGVSYLSYVNVGNCWK